MEFELSQIEGMIHQDLLPNCPPTKFDPTNLEEARRHPDTVQRYYASELMEIADYCWKINKGKLEPVSIN